MEQLTNTAIPLRSEEAEAAVGAAFGTLSVAVSAMYISSTGSCSTRDATFWRMKCTFKLTQMFLSNSQFIIVFTSYNSI